MKISAFRTLSIVMLVLSLFAADLNTVSAQEQQSIDFNHIFDDTFRQETVRSPNWMKSGAFFTALDYNSEEEVTELRKYDIRDNSFEVLVTDELLTNKNNGEPVSIDSYAFSSDEQMLLIASERESIWRRSSVAIYYVYDLEQQALYRINPDDRKIGNAAFSPEGDKVGYTLDNNLYVYDVTIDSHTQITNDGKKNSIINGSTDWVYEEEFSFAKAWFWSPDGERIAYYRFDEERVREYQFPVYKSEDAYPGVVRYKYPKAGEQNAIVTIGVYDLASEETTWMDIGDTDDQYIVRVNWADDETVAIRRMNRLQNKQDLMLADPETGDSKIIKTEVSSTWIDENDDLTFINDGQSFIYVSEESGYNHIYLYKRSGKMVRQITQGNWNVTAVHGIDEENEQIYFSAAKESPLERHFYRIDFDGDNLNLLTEESGVHRISLNGDYSYYLNYFSNTTTPTRVTLHKSDGDQVRLLEDNQKLTSTIAKFAYPQKEFINVPVNDTLELNGYILKPADFDPNREYPVLMYVYGGPGSQTVMNSFSSGQRAMWHNYLVSNGYLVVSVDNRGTGARSAAFKKIIYKQLGYYETMDQITAAEYIGDLSYVNADRIGIWGWSYGGYMSSLSLARGHDVFSAAIAVAPVTSWRFYDTIYTERFMQTPQENPDGYDDHAPINEAGNIEDPYLLVHGTADDNVHFQNAIEMARALQNEGVEFESMFYPDKAHSIGGSKTRKHLYNLLTRFVFENL